MLFKTSLDNLAKSLTIGFALFALAIIGIQYYYAFDSGLPVFTLLILFLIYVIGYLFAPRNYSITANTVLIHRPLTNISIKKNDIKSVEIVERNKISKAWRIFGVGGLFGYYGRFWNSEMGTMTFYATRTADAILIRTHTDKKIILTPDEPEAFLRYYTAGI
jgi:Bacterial PH domain